MGESNTEIFERLGRIEQTLARIDERTSRHETAHGDHEQRIRALERDFIPVRVGSGANAVGYMYDRVSGQLFGNAGTGAFVIGPDK